MTFEKKRISPWLVMEIIIMAMFCIPAGESLAHGVNYHMARENAVCITVVYDSGEPMSYAEVGLFSPSDPKIEYQIGRTDKNGCFAFVPADPGTWTISVDDGMAHAVHTTFEVGEALTVETRCNDYPRWMGIVSGLCVILGISSMLICVRYKKKEKERKDGTGSGY